jgi:DNA-directed RNA polymerase subunit M/transcription elongation factor TFIIS
MVGTAPVKLRACERCRGNMIVKTDHYGTYMACQQCGSHKDIGRTRLDGVRQEISQEDYRIFSLLRYVGDYPEMKKKTVAYGVMTQGDWRNQKDKLVVLCPFCPRGKEMTNEGWSGRGVKGHPGMTSILFRCRRERHIVELVRSAEGALEGWK